jgi:ribosomal protein S27AE
MRTQRPRRTTIADARAQFATHAADVINVSNTGALVKLSQPHAVGSLGPLQIAVGGAPLDTIARVVRCEPVAGPLTTSTGRFLLALTFVNPSEAAVARIDELCRTGRRAEADERRLRVTLTRRCPKCGSRDVAKDGKRSYSCGQCGRVFAGFRVAFLRFAR